MARACHSYVVSLGRVGSVTWLIVPVEFQPPVHTPLTRQVVAVFIAGRIACISPVEGGGGCDTGGTVRGAGLAEGARRQAGALYVARACR